LCPSANAVVLAADTRATNGEAVADKRCEKIHRLAPNIYCCGAGTAADAEQLTRAVAVELTAQRWALRLAAGLPPGDVGQHSRPRSIHTQATNDNNDEEEAWTGYEIVDATSRVAAAHCLLKKAVYRGHRSGSLSCALVLGGVDAHGQAKLVQVHGGGSSEHVRAGDENNSSGGVPSPYGESSACGFAALGSGELAAVSALEGSWRPDLTLAEAVALAAMAARAGVTNDLGSGGGVDVCILAGSRSSSSSSSSSSSGGAKVKYVRGYRPEDPLPPLPPGALPAANFAAASEVPRLAAPIAADLAAAARTATSTRLGRLPPRKPRSPLSGPNREPPEELRLI
jgi:20S proteasome alpha/beta subunit